MMVGQPRAYQALSLGFSAKETGFNIFVAGPSGTGKTTTVTDFLEDLAKKLPTPMDWCYVHNFEDEYQPNKLRCPPGVGKQLKQDMRELIQAARIAIHQVFEGEDYANKREEIIKKVNTKREGVITRMGQTAEEAGFILQLTPVGMSLVPVIKGKPLKANEFISLPKEAQQKFTQQREVLTEKLQPFVRELRDLEAAARNEIAEFDRDVTLYAIDHLMSTLLEKYKPHEEIVQFLHNIQTHIADDIDRFRGPSGENTQMN
jgi:septin family protein